MLNLKNSKLFAVSFILLNIFFFNKQIHAQCHIEDWTALKALYESTDGSNWRNNEGWQEVAGSKPSVNCSLRELFGVNLDEQGRVMSLVLYFNYLNGSIPAEIGNLSNLITLVLYFNQLSGNIPAQLGNLSNLEVLALGDNSLSGNIPAQLGNLSNLKTLALFNNQLSGGIPVELGNLSNIDYLNLEKNRFDSSIPAELGNLSNLEIFFISHNQFSGGIPAELGNSSKLIDLRLTNNQLSGSIPAELGNLRNLETLSMDGNQFSGSIPAELGNLSSLGFLSLSNNQLKGSVPAELGNLNNLEYLYLYDNQLSGSIPAELGNLNNLWSLYLYDNQLSGSIPAELGNLNNLRSLSLSSNQLSGSIPAELSNLSNLHSFSLNDNYFSCSEIESFISLNQTMQSFIYLPQYYTPINYDAIKSNVFDTISQSQNLNLAIDFPFDITGFTYQWYRNGTAIPSATQAYLNLETIQRQNVGKYTLQLTNENCLPEGNIYETISEPIYVILKGYDLLGQPVEYDQIMVEFDDKEETIQFETEILSANAGWVKKACNCNRELYLWQFPSTEQAAQALVEIDRKLKRTKKKSNIRGGFNNLLKVGEVNNTQSAFTIKSDSLSNNNVDSATIFILDSGLQYQNSDTPFLFKNAPVDSCYGIEDALGYTYTDTTNNEISNTIPLSENYSDEHGHGSYGFRSITTGLNENHNIKIVPLKVFNKNGQGNLFNLTCALYHAIDHNADVINISAGYSGQPSDIFERAIQLAREKEIFIMAAAGNDTINMDSLPQYPAYYASQYYTFETTNNLGNVTLDSLRYDNVITVISIDEDNNISRFSNFGKQSTTLAAYGERIHGYGLGDSVVVASGTSMATYFVTKELALEIAANRNRTYQEIWSDFEQNRLVDNNSIKDVTRTGKQLKVQLEKAIIYGCTDPNSCNYFEYVTDDDGTCTYNDCKCVHADWTALKALYQETAGDNWKRNSNWELLELNAIPQNCDFDNLHGIQLNDNGRVAAINLYNNNLTGKIPKELMGLTELNSLYLAANSLVGEIPEELSELAYLENLILTANNLTGPIPLQFGELDNLKKLYLSYNHLSGEIPTQLFQLNQLEYLMLDNNVLQGKLPSELSLLKKLYLLRLNDNELSGCYDIDLSLFCNQLWSPHFEGNGSISEGNNFETDWESFCLNSEGLCLNERKPDKDIYEFKIFPNPTKVKLTVEFLCADCNITALSILNLEGKNLLQLQGNTLSNNLVELDLSKFLKGMYFIEMKTEHHYYTEKFIIE